MPRDYAKSTRKKSKGQLPGWAWMLGGLCIGLFVSFLVYLNYTTDPTQQSRFAETISETFKDTRDVRKEKRKAPPPPPAGDEKPKQKFDFYTILPELEVAIPEDELSSPGNQQPEVSDGVEYILQAGSFRSHKEADKLKAKLALQGIEASIQTVTINNNDTWHRVRIGPLSDKNRLGKTRRRLQEIGIHAIVVKAKG